MFVARDMFINDPGKLVVSLFSLINVMHAKGAPYDQGEQLQWLRESVLYPTNFLPSERLHWSSTDSNTAKLTYTYKGISLFFNITFNMTGKITVMETERYMNK